MQVSGYTRVHCTEQAHYTECLLGVGLSREPLGMDESPHHFVVDDSDHVELPSEPATLVALS